MKKYYTLLVLVVILSALGIWKYNASQPNDTVKQTLAELDGALATLEKEASEDKILMKFIADYRSQSLSQQKLVESLSTLKGAYVDIIPMMHSAYGMNAHDGRKVVDLQRAISKTIREKYDLMWTEDATGGNVVTLSSLLNEIKVELQNTTVPLKSYDFSEKSLRGDLDGMLPFSAGIQLVTEQQGVVVMGGDYRPIKNIHQRILEYAALYDHYGKAPSSLDPAKVPAIRLILSKGRDLYLLKYIAENRSNKRQVIVFGAAHVPHLTQLMKEYGVNTELIEFGFE